MKTLKNKYNQETNSLDYYLEDDNGEIIELGPPYGECKAVAKLDNDYNGFVNNLIDGYQSKSIADTINEEIIKQLHNLGFKENGDKFDIPDKDKQYIKNKKYWFL